VELYLRSPIRLHGVVLNSSSRRTTLRIGALNLLNNSNSLLLSVTGGNDYPFKQNDGEIIILDISCLRVLKADEEMMPCLRLTSRVSGF
jgi:hypothetical protein